MGTVARLTRYRQKRDFGLTPEPSRGRSKRLRRFPAFVIQKHAARRLHYDFRLEDEGVLKSWAVPKGPSLNPKDRRLAMQTEDHPMDYAGFEGNIPKGEYGGGAVIVWDKGVYANLSQKNGKLVPLAKALQKGHAHIWLQGRKLQGGFELVRLAPKKNSRPWLLIKSNDHTVSLKRDPVADQPASVLSGKTVEEMAFEAVH